MRISNASPRRPIRRNFNASNDNNNFDDRSDNKGPEPEGLAVGTIDGRSYVFVGLERTGGIAAYDITTPTLAGVRRLREQSRFLGRRI